MAGQVKVFLSICFLSLGLSEGRLLDLSYVLDPNLISYPPNFGDDRYRFQYFHGYSGPFQGIPGTFVAFNYYSTVEHMGTHVDAPYHFNENGRFIDQVPLDDLIGPLVVIDISERAKEDRNAAVSVEDLQAWEALYGPIPDRSFTLMTADWHLFWGDNDKFLGNDGDPEGPMNFPGFGEEAIEWLLANRNILGAGVDTISCDPANFESEKYANPAHQMLLGNQLVCIENLNNINKAPACGAKLFALPVMTKNGTAMQARVFAEWEEGKGYQTDCGGTLEMVVTDFRNGGTSIKFPFYALLAGLFLVIKNTV